MTAKVTAFVLALTFVGASTASASSITINTNPGTTYTTSGVSDFSINSSQMNGMEITAYWTVNGGAQLSQTKVWNNGVAFTGSNFDLGVSGDTFNSNAWNLDFDVSGTGLLQRLVFNGVPGNTVFDRTNPSIGSVGSNQGKDLDGFQQYCSGFLCLFGLGTQGNVTATYFNQVRVGANPFAGDLYAGLQIDFLSFGGLGERSDWQFSLDTDLATAPLTTVQTTAIAAVPEPGSMVLLGTGLLGLAAAARRRASRRPRE